VARDFDGMVTVQRRGGIVNDDASTGQHHREDLGNDIAGPGHGHEARRSTRLV
jgi:hypothetical protein